MNRSLVYDPAINFVSRADANFSTDPDISLSVTGNVSNIDLESRKDKSYHWVIDKNSLLTHQFVQ